MSLKSLKSKVCLTDWLTDWQGHLLSCPGQWTAKNIEIRFDEQKQRSGFWLLTLSFQFLLSQACGSIKGYLDGRNSFCFSRHCYFVELNTESRVPAAIIWHKYHISSMLTSIDIDFLTALFMICYYWSTDNHKRLNLLKSLMAWSQFWAERTGRGWFSED